MGHIRLDPFLHNGPDIVPLSTKLTRAQLRSLVTYLHAQGYLGRLAFYAGER
jgi:hypothetical protein